MTENTTPIEARVARLEKTNRWLVSPMLTGTVLFLLTAAMESPATIQATAFELVAPDGSVRAELALRDGHPGLYLKDTDGVDRVALFESIETNALYLIDGEGTTRVGVAQFAHGGGGFALHGEESRGATVLYFKNEGSLRFFDEDGAMTRIIPASDGEQE